MLSREFRYIALDFETTGLDPLSDEPIQIGIIEFNNQGKIIGGFQSLLHPQKPIKELKSIVWFITGLSIEKLEDAPSCAELEKEIWSFFCDRTVLIGHNIGFDIAFLERFFPHLKRKMSIDTFRLSQTLIHYAPSYALEVLIDTLRPKLLFQELLERFQLRLDEEAKFHDAFFDAKLSIVLFRYLVQRVELLCERYPVLELFISQSKGAFSSIFHQGKKSESSFPITWKIEIPSLKKITAPNTQMLTGSYPFSLRKEMSLKKFQVKGLELKKLLSALATNKQSIFAFSNKSKLDIAKNLLYELGIKNLGFVKEEQTLHSETLERFVNKGQFEESEFLFLLKYFSHLEQGLGVLDLNSKGDYELYTALKDQRVAVNYPVILTTHGGLFSLLEQTERYQDYAVFFFDCEWRYKSYNFYLSRPYDLNYTLNYLDMLSYKYHLEQELEQESSWKEQKEKKLTQFEAFKQFFTMFIGILGQETKKFFTNTEATLQTLPPLKENLAFFQTNILLERFSKRESTLQALLSSSEFTSIRKQIEHMHKIFEGMMVVEKKMYSTSGFYFVYAEEVKFTNWEEFLEEFHEHPTVFLSHTDGSLPELIPLPRHSGQSEESNLNEPPRNDKKVIHKLSKIPSVIKTLETFDDHTLPNRVIFILSVKKEESRALFEMMIAKGLDQNFLLLVENITWGSGKNLFKAKQQGRKVIIGGYNFLLQLFAQKIAISQLIIYNSKWNQQDLIFSDILRYGQEDLH